ncbi:MAG: exodeoxyribonuclease VII large subunit, partial [Acidimicrobiia bacterium]|nr:exodeoxyribonuclease VII large subunit [Acidimicrobiia bacterium]
MDQPLFVEAPPDPPRGDPSFTVAQLGEILSGTFQQLFPDDIWVEGEISNLTRSRAGHVYFDLIEPATPGTPSAARISVVLFSQTRQVVNAQLKRQNVGRLGDGMAVRVRAAVDFYPPQGRLQLRMTGIDPRYILAAMAAERDALMARLHEEGVTARNKAYPVPLVPLTIGLVTSAVSAAAGDFLAELDGFGFGFRVIAVDARVQGELAPGALVGGLRALYREDVDLIALVRGGGARGDLSVFDNEQLARTIAESPVPVWTGIGHEIDRSVADVVAHTSYKTPTAVASALGHVVASFVDQAERAWTDVCDAAGRRLDSAATALTASARRGSLACRESLVFAEHRLDARRGDLPKLADRVLRSGTTGLDHLEARLRASDPATLRARGWSVTRSADGMVIRSIDEIEGG